VRPFAVIACAVVAALASPAAADARPGQVRRPPPINVTYDAAHLDLDHCVLQFQISRRASTASLMVIGEDGKTLGVGMADLSDQRPHTWIPIKWTQPKGTRVLKLQLRIEADDGVATNVQLIPWSVEVAHEDVNFATDSAAIEAGERAKLDASYAAITRVVERSKQFVAMQLYIAGHTDTVGPAGKNKTLSLARARAIAKYFREKGLAIPIAFAGFGEAVLKVKTGDNVDERRNRRADYVIGPAGGAPPFGGPYRKARAGWHALK